jgi:hypothetical protein
MATALFYFCQKGDYFMGASLRAGRSVISAGAGMQDFRLGSEAGEARRATCGDGAPLKDRAALLDTVKWEAGVLDEDERRGGGQAARKGCRRPKQLVPPKWMV